MQGAQGCAEGPVSYPVDIGSVGIVDLPIGANEVVIFEEFDHPRDGGGRVGRIGVHHDDLVTTRSCESAAYCGPFPSVVIMTHEHTIQVVRDLRRRVLASIVDDDDLRVRHRSTDIPYNGWKSLLLIERGENDRQSGEGAVLGWCLLGQLLGHVDTVPDVISRPSLRRRGSCGSPRR